MQLLCKHGKHLIQGRTIYKIVNGKEIIVSTRNLFLQTGHYPKYHITEEIYDKYILSFEILVFMPKGIQYSARKIVLVNLTFY